MKRFAIWILVSYAILAWSGFLFSILHVQMQRMTLLIPFLIIIAIGYVLQKSSEPGIPRAMRAEGGGVWGPGGSPLAGRPGARRSKREEFPVQRGWQTVFAFSPIEWGILVGIFFKLTLSFINAWLKPLTEWDAWSRFGLVGKEIFYHGTLLHPYLLFRLEDYPPFVPLVESWHTIAWGGWHEGWIKLFSPLLLLAFAILFYEILVKRTSKFRALLFTYILISLPLLHFHSYSGYADFPLTVYFSIGTLLLFQSQKDDVGRNDLLWGAIFLGTSIWVKRAGIYLAGPVFLIFVLASFLQFARGDKDWLGPPLRVFWILLAIGLPWVIYNQAVSSAHYYNVSQVASSVGGINLGERMGSLVEIAITKLFFTSNWTILWAWFIGTLVLFQHIFRKNFRWIYPLTTIVGLCLIAGSFLFTSSYNSLLDGTLWNRVVMYVVPLALYTTSIPLQNPET